MPQRSALRSRLAVLYRQVTKALALLAQEIARRERELTALKSEVTRWQQLLSGRAAETRRGTAAPPPSPKIRLDWHALLQELPARFTAKDLAEKTHKPLPQVYIALARLRKAKQIRKSADGYQKVSLPARPPQKKTT
jgi:hypothetical protein